ncbi:VanZ family protein [Streptomyces sp. YU58]|uniref:VanZ family protein n=1 Tax=Streptomyces sp. SX92 TaxID=3158972 RepID=UPI0027B91734|nr:VanZ family protein [Streptomyces coralus]WLW50021.1 VanZ family protein [Streptomyces coralus]
MARAAFPRSAFRLRTPRSEAPDRSKARPRSGKADGKAPPESGKADGRARPKPGKTGAGARPKPGRAERGGRRPLPFLLRLLAMLFAFAFMVAFAVVLARLTLEPSPASAPLTHTNMRPGSSLRAYLDQPELRDAVRQIGGNLVLGIPFGILAPVLAPRTRGVLRVLLLTAVVMLMVEFAQGALVDGRAFDVDDVILNTTGALIGYLLLGRRLSRAVHS